MAIKLVPVGAPAATPEDSPAPAAGGIRLVPVGDQSPKASAVRSIFPNSAAEIDNPNPLFALSPGAGLAMGALSDVASLEQRVWGSLTGISDFADPDGGVFQGARTAARQTLDSHIQSVLDSDMPDIIKKAAVTGLRGESMLSDMLINTAESPLTSLFTLGGSTLEKVAAGKTLKAKAGEILQSAVKPSKAIMRKRNAPDFVEPLRKNQVPIFGGLKKVKENVGEETANLARQRDALISKSQIQVNIPGALAATKKEIINRLKTGHGLSRADVDKALAHADDALATAAERPTFNNGWVSGEDAVALRKTADKKGKFNAIPGTDNSAAIFNEAYRTVIEQQISTRMQGKAVAARIGPKGAAQYEQVKKELAKMVPLDRALADRVLTESNNFKVGLTDNISLAAGAASGNMTTAASVMLVNRLLKTPGGAAILYKIGKATEAGPVQKFILEAAKKGKAPVRTGRLLNAIANEENDAKRQELIDELKAEK